MLCTNFRPMVIAGICTDTTWIAIRITIITTYIGLHVHHMQQPQQFTQLITTIDTQTSSTIISIHTHQWRTLPPPWCSSRDQCATTNNLLHSWLVQSMHHVWRVSLRYISHCCRQVVWHWSMSVYAIRRNEATFNQFRLFVEKIINYIELFLKNYVYYCIWNKNNILLVQHYEYDSNIAVLISKTNKFR